MTKRPTDHLEPAPKKRSGDRQISREEPPSDSEGEPVSTSHPMPSTLGVHSAVTFGMDLNRSDSSLADPHEKKRVWGSDSRG